MAQVIAGSPAVSDLPGFLTRTLNLSSAGLSLKTSTHHPTSVAICPGPFSPSSPSSLEFSLTLVNNNKTKYITLTTAPLSVWRQA